MDNDGLVVYSHSFCFLKDGVTYSPSYVCWESYKLFSRVMYISVPQLPIPFLFVSSFSH